MADVKLASGEILPVDLNAVSIREYRSLFQAAQADDEEYSVIGKIIGKTGAQVGELGQVDYRRVLDAIVKAAREPLDADPKN